MCEIYTFIYLQFSLCIIFFFLSHLSFFCSLSSSKTKYESGSGWPSFHSAEGKSLGDAATEVVETRIDTSHSMVRTEVLCRKVLIVTIALLFLISLCYLFYSFCMFFFFPSFLLLLLLLFITFLRFYDIMYLCFWYCLF